MTPDQLRALAEALEPMSAAPRFDCLPVVEFCAWLRQCAEEKPVAWRVECRWKDRSIGGDWRKYADYGTEQAAASSQQVFAKPGDIESRIVPLFTHPAPAAPQAEPQRELSEKQIADACLRYRHDFGLLDKYERDCIVNEARRWADAFGIGGSDADYWLRHRQAILDAIRRDGFVLMSNACGFWLKRMDKASEAHKIGGSDAE